jgi:uncharacterized membrane protein YhaH (DUF805 family)
MHKIAALLIFSVLAEIPIMHVLQARMTTLPSPLLVVVAILVLVAVFGIIISLLFRRKGKK